MAAGPGRRRMRDARATPQARDAAAQAGGLQVRAGLRRRGVETIRACRPVSGRAVRDMTRFPPVRYDCSFAFVVMGKTKKVRPYSLQDSAKSLQENATRSASAAGASYTLIGAIIVLGGLGYGFDLWRGTAPWGLFTGLLLGIVVGFYELIKTMWKR